MTRYLSLITHPHLRVGWSEFDPRLLVDPFLLSTRHRVGRCFTRNMIDPHSFYLDMSEMARTVLFESPQCTTTKPYVVLPSFKQQDHKQLQIVS
jgi:hypothetical protein